MKKMLKTCLAASVVLVAYTSSAVAAEATSQKHAEAAVKYRQSLFQLIKSNMGPLGGMAKGAIPFDESVMATNAMRIEQLADMLSDYLSVDTRKFDVETEAKPKIWDNTDDVESKIARLQKAAANLQAVVAAKDKDNYRSAIGEIGGSCKGCHDEYTNF